MREPEKPKKNKKPNKALDNKKVYAKKEKKTTPNKAQSTTNPKQIDWDNLKTQWKSTTVRYPKAFLIPETELEQIKREVSLVDLAANKGVKLKKIGKELSGKCPFHLDKTPSLFICPSKNLWHCFGCGAGGTNIDWIMKSQNAGFRCSVEILRDMIPSLSVYSNNSSNQQNKSNRPSCPLEKTADDYTLLSQVARYYHSTLKNTPSALEYLQKRGITSQALENFHIGFADRSLGLRIPESRSKEGAAIRQRLKKLGLFTQRGNEFFTGCVVVPIKDKNGLITEIYGRRTTPARKTKSKAHLFLPGPHQGIFNPKCTIPGEVILTEAIFDALSFWCHNLRNVTASYGTQGFSKDHKRIFLENLVKRVYIAYDPDSAGESGADKVATQLIPHKIECRRIIFPEGMDANEFVLSQKHPEQALRKLLAMSIPMGNGNFLNGVDNQNQATKEENSHTLENSNISQNPKEAAKEENSNSIQNKPNTQPQTNNTPKFIPPIPLNLPVKISKEELTIEIDSRNYRIRGFEKNHSFDSIRINIRVFQGERFHIDTFDLYNSRQRSIFIKTTAHELGITFNVHKRFIYSFAGLTPVF